MSSSPKDKESTPSQAELDALLKDMPAFSLHGVRATLAEKSPLFRFAWWTLITVSTIYCMAWFSGLLKPYLAAAATGVEADFQMHQVRFFLAFLMTVAGIVAMNFHWRLKFVFSVLLAIQGYFLFSGVIRHWRALPQEELGTLLSYSGNLLFIFILMLILLLEERRLEN